MIAWYTRELKGIMISWRSWMSTLGCHMITWWWEGERLWALTVAL